MFKIAQSKGYWWDCTITLVDESGQQVESTLPLQFKRMTQSEYNELLDAIRAGIVTDQELCEWMVTGWRDVSLTDDPIEFTPENLKTLLDMYGVRAQVVTNWFDSFPGARIKN